MHASAHVKRVQCAYLLLSEGAIELLAVVRSGDATRGLVLALLLDLRGMLEIRGAKLRVAERAVAAGVLGAVLVMLLLLVQAVPQSVLLLALLLMLVLLSCSGLCAVASSMPMLSSSASRKLLVAATICSLEMLLMSNVRTALSTGVTGAVGAVGAASLEAVLISALLSVVVVAAVNRCAMGVAMALATAVRKPNMV
jgi:hypothetical protein